MSISAGTKLGRYEIRSKIGEGGMGEVYLAQDTKLDRKVAMKILPTNHPNILLIHDVGTMMERLRGLRTVGRRDAARAAGSVLESARFQRASFPTQRRRHPRLSEQIQSCRNPARKTRWPARLV